MPHFAPIPPSARPSESPPRPVSPHRERVEDLRIEINRRLDAILTGGGARLASLQAEFHPLWREFTSQVDKKQHP
jgi:hypothetical protein